MADLLTKEALIAAAAAAKLPRERLEIAELGGAVIVQGMSGKQRDAWETGLYKGRGKHRRLDTGNVRARLAVRCLINEQGARLFNDSEADLLGNLPATVLQQIFDTAQKLSGVSDDDLDELGQPSAPEDGTDSRSNSPSS